MRSGAGMEVHGVSEKNLLKLVMKKRCAHTDKNLKLLIRIHMPSAGHNLEIVSSSRKDAKSGVSSRELFVNLRAGPEMPQPVRTAGLALQAVPCADPHAVRMPQCQR